MLYNPFIVVPLATWAITQLTKFIVAAIQGRLDLRLLYASGGMPSVHSAVVCSLAVTAGVTQGFQSPLFGFTVIFAAIVMYDSFGVRRSSGEQAAAINMLISSLGQDKVRLSNPGLQLREILGHQPREVAVGAALGIFLGLLFNYEHIKPLTGFLTTVPSFTELLVYLVVGLVLIIGSIILRLILKRRKSKALTRLSGRLLTLGQTTGWIMLVFCAAIYERVGYLAWRFWPLAVIAWVVVWSLMIAAPARKQLPVEIAAEIDAERKNKWMPKKRKRR